jgi:hypothetical protein
MKSFEIDTENRNESQIVTFDCINYQWKWNQLSNTRYLITTFFVLYRSVVASFRVNLHCTIRVVSALHATVVSKSCTV